MLISGALAGFGGGFLSIQLSSPCRKAQAGGKGFIGLATMIFETWRRGGLLFGFTETLRLRDPNAPHALLLVVTIATGLLALRALYRRRWKAAAGLVGIGGLIGTYCAISEKVPTSFRRSPSTLRS